MYLNKYSSPGFYLKEFSLVISHNKYIILMHIYLRGVKNLYFLNK